MKLPIRREVEEAFAAVLAVPEEDQDAFLARKCGGQPELRADVEFLLRAHRKAGRFLEPPEPSTAALPLVSGTAAAGVPPTIGPYRVLRLLGEGGMGAVYEAEQDQPRRTVALKLIRSGFASPELLRRFQQETQALGRLQHPGIAHIYEAGAVHTGVTSQPYFAMEFIRGQPLLEYASAHHLDTAQRLILVIKVCDAVHHAHQRGIIHRDLKPGNILVDETGQPKVLDFGVARAVDTEAPGARRTEFGQLIGTLAYMSPEQVQADPLELDTRSDVYALGVILFEILSGRLPYVISPRLHEAVQTIREETPPPLGSVERRCRGDIETIVAKALEKDKARRYSSAADLAAEIQRHLNHEPILAKRASVSYKLGKFARRHTAFVAAAAIVSIVLLAGIVISTREAAIARRAQQEALRERDRAAAAEGAATKERDRALTAEHAAIVEKNRAISEKLRADTESSTARAISDFLQNGLLAQAGASAQARPDTKPDPDLKVRTALDRAARRISGTFEKQPLVEASIRQTIADAYRDLGLYAEAQGQVVMALKLQQRILGSEHPDTLTAMTRLAEMHRILGQYPQAEPLYLKVLTARRRLLGEAHPATLTTMHELALLYYAQGKYAQAESLYPRILQLKRRVLGEQHPDTLLAINNLAGLYLAEGNYARAEPLYAQVLKAQRDSLGEEHPDTLSTMNNLAVLYKRQGSYAQAEPLYTKVLEVKRRVLGAEHPDTLISVNNLATLYQAQGEFVHAEELLKGVVEIRRRALGHEHPSTLRSMNTLAAIYLLQGRNREAELLFENVLEVRRRKIGREHPDTLDTMFSLARLYAYRGDFPQADATFTEVLEIQRRVLGPEHPDTVASMNELARSYLNQGKCAQAEPLFTRVLDIRRRVLGPDHLETTNTLASLGIICLYQRRYQEAESFLRDAVNRLAAKNSDRWEIYHRKSMLGATLAAEARFSEAEALLLSGHDGLVQRRSKIPWGSRGVVDQAGERIVRFYQQWGQPKKAAEWRAKLFGNQDDAPTNLRE